MTDFSEYSKSISPEKFTWTEKLNWIICASGSDTCHTAKKKISHEY